MNLKKLTLATLVAGGALALSTAAFAGGAKASTTMDAHSSQLTALMNANTDHVAGHPGGSSDWYRRIKMSGMINVDGTWSSRDTIAKSLDLGTNTTADQSQADFGVNNASLFVDAKMSNNASGHISFSYENTGSAMFAPKMQGNTTNWRVDEAFVTLANLNKLPLFVRAGREYVDFGDYNLHPMLDSYTQLLSETNGSAFNIGFIAPVGLYGDVYAMDDSIVVDSRERGADNYGARLGFGHMNSQFGYDFHGDYIRNMGAATYVNGKMASTTAMTHRVGGLALHGMVNSGPFDVTADYVTATRAFAGADLGYNPDNVSAGLDAAGAEPWATNLTVGYKFRVSGYRSHLAVSYQRSGEASANSGKNGNDGLFLPQTRYEADYTMNMFKHTDLMLGVASDHDYSFGTGGTGKSGTTGVARLSFQFA